MCISKEQGGDSYNHVHLWLSQIDLWSSKHTPIARYRGKRRRDGILTPLAGGDIPIFACRSRPGSGPLPSIYHQFTTSSERPP